MTQKFITSCYVRVDDKDKRKEVCEKLDKLGYNCLYNGSLHDNFISTYESNYAVDYKVHPASKYNCGTNTDLFLALAGMREDTDKGQRFTDGEHWYIMNEDKKGDDEYLIDGHLCHCATTEEIIEHFKKKGESK